jgi:hypothetical protein
MKSVANLLLAGDDGSEEFYRSVERAGAADVREVLQLTQHDDPGVRRAAIFALPLLTGGDEPIPDMVVAAVGLTTDPDKHVRDAACFALAEQWRDVDTRAVRDALAARLDDIDRDTRSEALVGLAYRQDPRALPRVREALSRPTGTLFRLELVAAGALSDPQLHDLVLRHQEGWDSAMATETAEAVRRLTDPNGPGEDILNGVATLYERRAKGRPEGDAVAAWEVMSNMLDIAPRRAPEFLRAVKDRVQGDAAALREVTENSALAQLAENVR